MANERIVPFKRADMRGLFFGIRAGKAVLLGIGFRRAARRERTEEIAHDVERVALSVEHACVRAHADMKYIPPFWVQTSLFIPRKGM